MAVCPHCSAELHSGARFCASCGQSVGQQIDSEPQFRAWRIRRITCSAIFCAIAIPVGFLFISKSPFTFAYVSGLGALGLIICLVGLSRLKGG